MENVDPPGTVTPLTPGEMQFVPRTDGGRYRVWIKGSFGRPTAAYIDGRKVGEADQINTPGQWEQVGEVQLDEGHASSQARAPRGSAAPGDGWRACSARWRSSVSALQP